MVRNILVVDDEKVIADTLTLILRQCGYSADAAYSGEDGLRYLEQHVPDLIISDVMMPGMNGIEFATQARRLCGCLVLLISGNANTIDLVTKADVANAFTLVAKPIHPADLLKKVRALGACGLGNTLEGVAA